MKKRILGITTLALIGVLAFTGCGSDSSKKGSFTERAGGYDYTANVIVKVDDSGKISEVIIDDTSSHYTKTAAGDWKPETWTKKQQEFLASLKGKTKEDIDSMLAKLTKKEEVDVVTGATLTSTRVLNAVKDALK